MGFIYRKSFNRGLFRVNLSKSGVGYSVGGRGFRVGITSRGRKSASLCKPPSAIHHSKSKIPLLVTRLPTNRHYRHRSLACPCLNKFHMRLNL
jgi:hypothetical protein